jgi:peptidoglycan/LPS O-acetylase OafA/YrhL
MPELDGLRGLAVLLTVLFHLTLYIPRVVALEPSGWLGPALRAAAPFSVFGATGVQLFFVLSGFLLFRPYAEAICARSSPPSTSKFFARRALRILPAYWTALFLIVVAQPNAMASGGLRDIALHAVLLHDWSESTIESINPPFWTMAVESQFYLLLPPLALTVHRLALRNGRLALAGLLAAIAGSSLLYVLFSAAIGRLSPAVATHRTILYPIGFLMTFGAGAALSFVNVGTRRNVFSEPWRFRVPVLARVAGLGGVGLLSVQAVGNVVHASSMDEHRALYWLWSIPLLSLGYGGLVIGTVLGFPSWKRLFSRPALRFVGIVSYSLYIWNIPLFRYAVLPIAGGMHSDLLTVLVGLSGTLAIVIPVSYLSYLLVERPAFSLRFRLR